jgi:hypothetical protein
MTTVPAKKPGFVSAKESTPGFFVSSQPGQPNMAFVAPDARSARAIREGGERTLSTCYAVDQGNEAEWVENMDAAASLWRRSREDPDGGVRAVHTERIVEKDGTFMLEVVDAWVDPATRGAKTIAKTKLPLELLAKPIGGVRVFAARDERKTGPSFVQFVVARPEGGNAMGGLTAVRMDGSNAHSNNCTHLRLSMAAPSKTGGESAVVSVTAVLPPLKKKTTATDEGKETRTRDIRVQLGISKTSRDKEPLLSVSFGWDGREQMVRNDLPDEGD